MKVIELAEKRLAEEIADKEAGADNTYLLNYWRAYLDGAKAREKEIVICKNCKHCSYGRDVNKCNLDGSNPPDWGFCHRGEKA